MHCTMRVKLWHRRTTHTDTEIRIQRTENFFQMRLRTYTSVRRIIVAAQQPQPHIALYKRVVAME